MTLAAALGAGAGSGFFAFAFAAGFFAIVGAATAFSTLESFVALEGRTFLVFGGILMCEDLVLWTQGMRFGLC